MSDIVNLNRYRKQRRKEEKTAEAAENRTRFGRSKAERRREADEAKRRDRSLDDAKLE
jgi:hypothetical protein